MEKFVELLWFAAQESSLLVDETLMHQIHSNLDHCSTSALTITSLEEPELTFLNGELHILHVVIVILELLLEFVKLLIEFRHSLFH